MKDIIKGYFPMNTFLPKHIYAIGIVFTIAGVSAFLLQENLTLFGPIGLSLLFMGYAEQKRLEAGSVQKSILHVIGCLVFIVTASYVIWLA